MLPDRADVLSWSHLVLGTSGEGYEGSGNGFRDPTGPEGRRGRADPDHHVWAGCIPFTRGKTGPRTAQRRETPGWVPVPILAYHEAADGPSPLDLSPQDFALELRYLARASYSPVTLDQVYRAFARRASLPDRPIVLTFDDGYESFDRSGFPLLQRYHYPATVFVSTGLVGRPGYLTWDQIRELARAGIEIGAHTVNHPDLRGLDDAQLQSEIAGSREVLAARLGHTPEFFAYPYGALNPRVVNAVRRAGFRAAVTGRPGVVSLSQDPFLWPRNVVVRGTGY